MVNKQKKTSKLPTQIEIIKKTRREVAPRGKIILSKKDVPFRKRKHKKLEID